MSGFFNLGRLVTKVIKKIPRSKKVSPDIKSVRPGSGNVPEHVGAGSIFPLLNSPGLSESWDGKGRLETPTPLRSLDLDKLGFEPPAVE